MKIFINYDDAKEENHTVTARDHIDIDAVSGTLAVRAWVSSDIKAQPDVKAHLLKKAQRLLTLALETHEATKPPCGILKLVAPE
jgi:hypothetical protein